MNIKFEANPQTLLIAPSNHTSDCYGYALGCSTSTNMLDGTDRYPTSH